MEAPSFGDAGFVILIIQTLINTNHHESNPVAPYWMHLKGNAHINLSKYMKIHNLAHQSPNEHTCASVLLHMENFRKLNPKFY